MTKIWDEKMESWYWNPPSPKYWWCWYENSLEPSIIWTRESYPKSSEFRFRSYNLPRCMEMSHIETDGVLSRDVYSCFWGFHPSNVQIYVYTFAFFAEFYIHIYFNELINWFIHQYVLLKFASKPFRTSMHVFCVRSVQWKTCVQQKELMDLVNL